MKNKYTEYVKYPELMVNRFENNFPLIYLGDQVKSQKHPEVSGQVTRIQHALMSIFNRDYLGVRIDCKKRQLWDYLCNLEVLAADSEMRKKYPFVYIDDRIEVIDRKNTDFGKTGNVRAMYLSDGKIKYEVRDDNFQIDGTLAEMGVQKQNGGIFIIDADSSKLVERFPPNDLFKK